VVREATKRLEQQGLVEIQHGAGIKIVRQLHRPLSDSLSLLIPDIQSRLLQLHETRLAIEPAAAALAALRASPEELRAIRDSHAKLQAATTTTDAIEADLEWHQRVAEAGGNRIFCLILNSLDDLGRESLMRTVGRIGKTTAVEHHALVLSALEQRDADTAAEAMRQHVLAALRDMRLDDSGDEKTAHF
jgi:GntR family transcriptional repressor for pyruvate dehydrogenase complex